MSVAGNVLERHLSDKDNDTALGELIQAADSSWKTPPVWTLDDKHRSNLRSAVSDLGVVSAFSAFDDTLNGYIAEFHRWKPKTETFVKEEPDALKALAPAEIDDGKAERIVRVYAELGWPAAQLDQLLPLIQYFKLCRNCIAHRSSRASPALANYSCSDELREQLSRHKKEDHDDLPKFFVDEAVT